ncbi:MAG: FkbM family methyltransferase [Bacteroidia bacterium]
MSNVVKHLYRTVIPESIRYKILEARKKRRVEKQKKEILSYYDTLPKDRLTPEVREVVDYLRKNPLHVFPYAFQKEFDSAKVRVFTAESGLRYVMHEGKKLYFKRNYPEEMIRNSYAFLQCEQHPDSPHRYLTDSFAIKEGSIVADVGAAEGIFPLAHIEKIRHLYFFEPDADWVEVLKETYKPWAAKVTIINKFVSANNDESHVSLDAYFKDKQQPDFLKVDVDGAETDLLEGSRNILKNSEKLNLALCTYHRQQDEQQFGELLKSYHFSISTSKGYMLFFFEAGFDAPYLRRGLIRATK